MSKMSLKYWVSILAIFLFFSSQELHAQRYPKSDKQDNLEAKFSHSGIYQKNTSIWSDGNKLSKKDLSAMDGFDIDLYSRGRTKSGFGIALVSIGAVPCAIGTAALAESIKEAVKIDKKREQGIEPLPSSGLAPFIMFHAYGVGLLFEAIGIPLLCSGKVDIRHAAVSYNGKQYVQYAIGPSTSGIGISLYF